MRVISHYIFRQVSGATAIVLLVVFGLDIVFRFANELSQLGGNYHFFTALWYVLLGSPLQFYSVMPLVGMIGCLLGLGSLASNSELIVMRSMGISTIRLTWMAMKPVLLFLVIAVLFGEYVAPKSEMYANSMKALAKSGVKKVDLKRLFWLRDKNNFIFIDIIRPNGQLQGVHIYAFNKDQQLEQLRVSELGEYNKNHWLLTDVSTTNFNNNAKNITSIDKHFSKQDIWHTDIKPNFLKIAVSDPRNLPMAGLYQYRQYLDKQHLNSVEYQLAFWEKVFYPLMVMSLILIGIAFVFGPLRQVTMGFRIFCGVMVGVLVKTLQTAVGPFSIVFGINPILAMALPSVICIVVGLFLLSRVR